MLYCSATSVTFTGALVVLLLVVVPSPSWPYVFLPQQYTSSAEVSAHAWLFVISIWVAPTTPLATGADLTVSVPSPICP